jgi:hypothetical protein
MKKLIVVASTISLLLSTVLPAYAFDDGDLQLWNTEIAEAKINDSLKVKIEEELRFGEDVSELYYTHTDGGFTYKLTDMFDVGLNYRLAYEKKDGEWKEENRPHVHGTLKWAWQDFKFKDRSRLECRNPEGKSTAWRYRNKLTVYSPWKWTEFDIQPYIADEIFVDFHGEKINRNRLYAGFGLKLIEHFKADLFYLWQSSGKKGKWTDYNVIGIKLKAIF